MTAQRALTAYELLLAQQLGDVYQRHAGFHNVEAEWELAREVVKREDEAYARGRRSGQVRGALGATVACLTLGLVVLFASCAIGAEAGWRTGFGIEVGLLDGDPATSVLLDFNPGPGSHWHVQPRASWWKPGGERDGTFGIGLDVLAHLKPCHSTSPYLGIGAGGEWRGGQASAPCNCPPPPPRQEDPPAPKDPPSGTLRAGLRFLPTSTIDLNIEGRVIVSPGARPRGGPFVGILLHKPRQIVGRTSNHGGRHAVSTR